MGLPLGARGQRRPRQGGGSVPRPRRPGRRKVFLREGMISPKSRRVPSATGATVKKLLVLLVALGSLDVAAQQNPAWDTTFRAIPDARNIAEYVRVMSARPHHLGSPYGKQNAEWIRTKLTEWGWEAT